MKKKIKLDNGFTCTIDSAVFDDWELTDILAELDFLDSEEDDNTLKIARNMKLVFYKVIGEKQYKALMDHLRTEKGTVPHDAVKDLLAEIFDKFGEESKN